MRNNNKAAARPARPRTVFSQTRVSTSDVADNGKLTLIRDAAYTLFNLEVDLGRATSDALTADIRIAHGPVASAIDVTTSASIVERTRRRASAATGGNYLVYRIRQGGSWFENGRGERFRTAANSIVVGSQDAPYRAGAIDRRDWDFQVLSVPERFFQFAGTRIRQGGVQLVPAHAPLSGLLGSYVAQLFDGFARLDAASAAASLRSLDHLLAGSLAWQDEPQREPQEGAAEATVAHERVRAAMRHARANLESPRLAPQTLARHLCISPRQLHRAFEAAGLTVAGEIRRERLARACELLRTMPAMPVTEVAFSCGFDSLATFYRAFKAGCGMTASEMREQQRPVTR